MSAELLPLLTLGVGLIALLYASVGHAGASGYIALMLLAGLSPLFIKPVALTLNVLVAAIATWQFRRAGHFRWSTFWPFAVAAVPCAFIGGYLQLPSPAFKLIVGAVLLCSAINLLLRPPPERESHMPPLPLALVIGAALGLLAGLTGTGGGIYLTPLLIFLHWAPTKTAAAVSAAFILLNSSSGLAGHYLATQTLPGAALPLAAAVIAGGTLGAWLGSHRLPQLAIKRALALVLVIAGSKLVGWV